MNNIELEQKIKELIKISNYFDMVIALKEFEKEYKSTEFYRITRQDLMTVVKYARMHYALQLNDLFDILQDKLNHLSLDNINDLADKFGEQLMQGAVNNQETIEELKDLIEEIK